MQDPERKIRVLLVDDEEAFRQSIARRLGRRGVDVREAGDGLAALEQLEKFAADVVVLDVKMPGMSGLEVLEKVRRDHPGIQVILLTGHAAMEDGISGIKAGAFDYLTKPVELEHLARKIRQAFDRERALERAEEERAFRARMEQQMIAAERLAALGTLAAGVAHEINNPLAIISEAAGFARLLLAREEAKHLTFHGTLDLALEKIETSLLRAKRITHQLLGFARNQDQVVKEVDIRELVGEVITLLAGESKSRYVAVVQEAGEVPVRAWTNPDGVRQVLLNLVANAVNASRPGQTVVVSAATEGDRVVLRVRDSGSGIPKENLERIFEPFFTTKEPGQGTGLGLFVCRNILERLGGEISVQSKVGRGAEFLVTLPKICRQGAECASEYDWRETARQLERSGGHGSGAD